MARSKGFVCLSLWLGAALSAACPANAAGDYPTPVVVDYVLGCLRSNGQTRDKLERCSCSIDVIASILPYKRYESAEAFKRMSLTTGRPAGCFARARRQKQPAWG